MTTGRLPTGGRTFADGEQNGVQALSVGTSDLTSTNPWYDARPGPSHRSQTAPQPLHHRLSYDHASGVIMLPEGENWLMSDEDSDSEEDYGTPSPQEETTASPGIETSPGGGASALPSDNQTPTPSPLKRKSLYSTYYHHPERRSRQTLPGAFEQGD
jgi:hypothetical protein